MKVADIPGPWITSVEFLKADSNGKMTPREIIQHAGMFKNLAELQNNMVFKQSIIEKVLSQLLESKRGSWPRDCPK
eukprot:5559818-Alexandrium_andersonii.AAC.1